MVLKLMTYVARISFEKNLRVIGELSLLKLKAHFQAALISNVKRKGKKTQTTNKPNLPPLNMSKRCLKISARFLFVKLYLPSLLYSALTFSIIIFPAGGIVLILNKLSLVL